MFRTHTCGELNLQSAGQEVTLSGWVQRIRDKGGLIWIDLRDRYGITQLMMEEGSSDPAVIAKAKELGREFVIQAKGLVIERISKNL
jgi:aspartyl-tRNA synthetase